MIGLWELVPREDKSALWRLIATLYITTLFIAPKLSWRYIVALLRGGNMLEKYRLLPALLFALVVASGCSTQQIAQFEAKVANSRCAKAGLVEGSADYERCVASHLAAADQERATSRAVLLGVADGAAQVEAAKLQGRSTSPSVSNTSYRLTRSWWKAGKRMCEYADGSILNVGQGDCPSTVSAPR